MNSWRISLVVVAFALSLPVSEHAVASTLQPAWARQFGTEGDDILFNVAVDAQSNSYAVGYALDPSAPRGQTGILRKYDHAGQLKWAVSMGEFAGYGGAFAVAAAPDRIVVAGGNWEFDQDAFLAEFNSDGQLQWSQILDFNSRVDGLTDVKIAADGSIYATGFSAGDALLGKWSATGSSQWLRRFGSGDADYATSVDLDPDGNVFIGGSTEGNLAQPVTGERDAFAARYTPDGDRLWLTQLANTLEGADLVASAEGVFLVGNQGTSLTSNVDSYAARISPTGQVEWLKYLALEDSDFALSTDITPSQQLIVALNTGSVDPGRSAYLASFTLDGTLQNLDSVGDFVSITTHGIATAGEGTWLVGRTIGSVDGPNMGGFDAFAMRLAIPEPSTALTLVTALLSITIAGRSRTWPAR